MINIIVSGLLYWKEILKETMQRIEIRILNALWNEYYYVHVFHKGLIIQTLTNHIRYLHCLYPIVTVAED